jgi:AcrR family transcriptional regulator
MPSKRKPEITRLRILKAAFEEMHRDGFQGMRMDAIVGKTDLKKGTLYYHFSSKQALGYAVLEEIILMRAQKIWIEPLKVLEDPIAGIQSIFALYKEKWGPVFFTLGCPLNNLAQEMAPIDKGFRERIQTHYKIWGATMAQALTRGKKNGFVKKNIDVKESAEFIISAAVGAFGQAKITQDESNYSNCGKQLNRYLETLSTKREEDS